MANELQYVHDATAKTLYAVIHNAASQVWNGSTFETLTVANWGNYDVALTETPASSYYYLADFPAGIAMAGDYEVVVYEQIGASPAITDTLLADGSILWDGSAEIAGSRLWRIPDAAPGGAGGLPTVDGNNRVAGVAGGLRIESA